MSKTKSPKRATTGGDDERVSDFLATTRKSVFLSNSEAKKILPSSHILKVPEASVGNLNVSPASTSRRGSKNEEDVEGGDDTVERKSSRRSTRGGSEKQRKSSAKSERSEKSDDEGKPEKYEGSERKSLKSKDGRKSRADESLDSDAARRKESTKSGKEGGEKKGKKRIGKSRPGTESDVDVRSKDETVNRKIPFPKQSADTDEVFQWLLEQESAKKGKFTSYEVNDLLRDMPEHQWLIVPSIKWTEMREIKEQQRILAQLEAEEVARVRMASMESEMPEVEVELEAGAVNVIPDVTPAAEPGSVELSHAKQPVDPCRPNPCPCKDRKRSPRPPPCCQEVKPSIKKTPSEQCWEDYLAREQKERRMRWFACVLVSAHTRRPNWIPPPEEYLRQQHKAAEDQLPPPPSDTDEPPPPPGDTDEPPAEEAVDDTVVNLEVQPKKDSVTSETKSNRSSGARTASSGKSAASSAKSTASSAKSTTTSTKKKKEKLDRARNVKSKKVSI